MSPTDMALFPRMTVEMYGGEAALRKNHFSPSGWGDPIVFPDGSLQVDLFSHQAFRRLYDEREDIDFQCFRNLAPFPPVLYFFFYPIAYQKKLGGEDIFLFPNDPNRTSPSENELSQMWVSVIFRRKPTAKILARLCDLLDYWQQTSQQGRLAGEGAAAVVSTEYLVRGNVVQFIIDIAQAGPLTVNWLMLCLFHFGEVVATVRGIAYADPEHYRAFFAYDVPTETTVPMVRDPKNPPWQMEEPQVEEPPVEEPVRVDASTQPPVASGAFPVQTTVGYCWENLVVAVIFDGTLGMDKQQAFRTIVESWSTAGQFGVYGGEGMRWCSEVTFSEERDTAQFTADMGDVREEEALPVLVKFLEGYDRMIAPIESVTLGK